MDPKARIGKSGFTIVELMVAAGIVGVLGAIAVPNGMKWQSKARQAEARSSLAGVYARERTYRVESLTYSACIRQLGFTQPTNNYYAVGFTGTLNDDCGKTSNRNCFGYVWSSAGTPVTLCTPGTDNGWPAVKYSRLSGTQAGAPQVAQITGPGGNGDMSRDAFIARAAGKISWSESAYDRWEINQDQQLVNTTPSI